MSFVVLNFIYKSENGTEKVLNPILKSEFENLPLLWIVENADFNFVLRHCNSYPFYSL